MDDPHSSHWWTPIPGEIILVGIPEICLTPVEFIGITSEGKWLHWNFKRTDASVTDPDFCHKLKGTLND